MKNSSNFILLLLFIHTISISQNDIKNDSLLDYSYQKLRNEYIKNYSDSLLSAKYANAFFSKALIEKDTAKIISGYYQRIAIENNIFTRFNLYDSLIDIAKKANNYYYLTISYYDKGALYQKKYKYSSALTNYIEASKYNKYNKNKSRKETSFLIDYSIGLLKLRIEENNEALEIFKKLWQEAIENDFINRRQGLYFNILFYLGDAHRKVHNIDSARTYTRLGLLDAKNNNSDNDYNLFLLLEGILDLENNIDQGISKLSSSLDYLKTQNNGINTSFGYQYLGKGYSMKGEFKKAVENYLKVDSIIGDNKSVFPELLYTYYQLRDHYKSKGDQNRELYFINKILKFDSLNNKNYRYLTNKINNDYKIPLLVDDKDLVINVLKFENNLKKYAAYSLLLLIAIITFVLFNQFRLKRKYEKKFKILLEDSSTLRNNQRITNDVQIKEISKIDVPIDLVEKIIKEISSFEERCGYLDRNINSIEFAKSIGTNNTYFTKVFKQVKGKFFSEYLRELRLKYALEKLKKDPKFRKYTVKAIAMECGFNNSESFSKNFHKEYGIYPSFFIKKLNNSKEEYLKF
ncbi:helix-turn-helix domain-containing protein [uncultured Dokdonia sp.]|mgnify:CR=1 FL=1|uniref:helix-turn-helix domain-containing protein n=1 Tax=uncultured Dokdonia sp. TaxID=575653 RepID=UPI002628E53E|nr:helix-turn-helix domain-containing protein [uncultured Dokdonia sp.]